MSNDLKRSSRFQLTKEMVDVLKQIIIASLNMKYEPNTYGTFRTTGLTTSNSKTRSKSTSVIEGLYLILAASPIAKEVRCADDGI